MLLRLLPDTFRDHLFEACASPGQPRLSFGELFVKSPREVLSSIGVWFRVPADRNSSSGHSIVWPNHDWSIASEPVAPRDAAGRERQRSHQQSQSREQVIRNRRAHHKSPLPFPERAELCRVGDVTGLQRFTFSASRLGKAFSLPTRISRSVS